MNKHTLPPYDTVFELSSGHAKIWADTELIGIIYQQGSADSALENADFIVRACNSHDDLLAALEAVAKRAHEKLPVPHHVGTFDGGLCESATCLIARAAIKKAKGGSHE